MFPCDLGNKTLEHVSEFVHAACKRRTVSKYNYWRTAEDKMHRPTTSARSSLSSEQISWAHLEHQVSMYVCVLKEKKKKNVRNTKSRESKPCPRENKTGPFPPDIDIPYSQRDVADYIHDLGHVMSIPIKGDKGANTYCPKKDRRPASAFENCIGDPCFHNVSALQRLVWSKPCLLSRTCIYESSNDLDGTWKCPVGIDLFDCIFLCLEKPGRET